MSKNYKKISLSNQMSLKWSDFDRVVHTFEIQLKNSAFLSDLSFTNFLIKIYFFFRKLAQINQKLGQYCNQRAKNVFCCKLWQYRNKLCSYNDRYIKNIFYRNFRKFLFVFKRAEIANKIKFEIHSNNM